MDTMRIALLSALCAICQVSASAESPLFPETTREIGGVPMYKIGEYRYVYRFFFKLYDAVLYADRESQAADIINRTVPFHLEFHYLRTIEKSIILESAAKMLAKNLSPTELAQIQDRVDRINTAYQTVQAGDRSSLTYIPDVGTILRINGAPVITIEGADFAEFYFEIWLGEQPISTDLKANLLGQS